MNNISEQKLKQIVDESIEKNKTILFMKDEIASVKEEVASVKEEQRRQGVLQDEMSTNIQRILDALSVSIEKNEVTDQHSKKIENLEKNTDVTQQVLKSHVSDKSIHLSPK